MSTGRRAALLAVLALCIPAAWAEGPQKIARDGSVHRVAAGVESGMAIGQTNPVRHFEQNASGETVTRIVRGTEVGWNFQPTLEIDPVTDEPVVAWTRLSGSDTDVYLSRYDGTQWSAPIGVAVDASEADARPAIIVGLNLVQVVWERQSSKGGIAVLRIGLDRATLGVVFGPETLPTAGISLIEPGVDQAAAVPAPGEELFVSDVRLPYSGADRVVIVFGIRDEPMPVGYAQGFILPEDVTDVRNARATWLGDRILLSFVSGHQLLYTVYDNGNWSALQRINLDALTPAAEARQQLVEMLERPVPEGVE